MRRAPTKRSATPTTPTGMRADTSQTDERTPNVSPTMLEDPIRANSIVGQVVVVGDQKPFIAALVTLDPEMLPTWLANNDLPAEMSLTEAANNPKVRAEVQRAIDIANKGVSERIITAPFSALGHDAHVSSKNATCMAIPTNQAINPLRNTEQMREINQELSTLTSRYQGHQITVYPEEAACPAPKEAG